MDVKVDQFPDPKGKIRIGIVNYLNTKPLIYGLERTPIREKIILYPDYPSRVAEMLKKDEIDVGLIPVATLPGFDQYYVAGNYCIGTEGEIATVALFSEVPMQDITHIYLDYQSRSSVALLKYLLKESWGIQPVLVPAEDEGFRSRIEGTTAGLVIGDRAFEQRKVSTYIYDLGSEWRAITGLPFVFAAWVSSKKLPDAFIQEFDEANALGLEHIDEIVLANPYAGYDLRKYFKLHLSYHLDDRKRKAMSHFLQVISEK